jgi:tetratricopeptide (TPR) repeat protein
MFRLLGLHPGADVEARAAAALVGLDLLAATPVLEQLVDANLLQQEAAGRYSFHDLVRDHARNTAIGDGADACRAALTRMFDHYLWTAFAAIEQAMPHPPGRSPELARPGLVDAGFAEHGAAEQWLRDEHDNLLAVAANTASGDWPPYACDLGEVLWRYQLARGLFHHAAALQESAVRAARRDGDPGRLARALRGQGNAWQTLSRYDQARAVYLQALQVGVGLGDTDTARTLNSLGCLAWRTGALEEAAEYLQRALRLYQRLGDVGAATALHNLGGVYYRLGRYPESADCLGRALALHTERGNRSGQADALAELGGLLARTGDTDQALDHLARGLAIAAERGYVAEAAMLETQGVIYGRLGRHRDAVDRLQRSLDLYRGAGHLTGQASAMAALGTVHHQAGDLDLALAYLHQARSQARRLGDRIVQVSALNALGAATCSAGRSAQALDHHRGALDLAHAIGERYEQALAHHGLSRAHADLGREDTAREHASQAAALFTALGVPGIVITM